MALQEIGKIMRFLVDESTGKRLAKLLENRGHDVVFVGDVAPSASDEEVLEKAEKENRILITDDKDFGELVFRMERPTKGVILLRTSTIFPRKRFEVLQNLFETVDELKNKFIVLKEDSMRIRNI